MSIGYKVCLALVAAAMILLPLIYLGLVAWCAYGLYWYATVIVPRLFAEDHVTFSLMVAYIMPLIVGAGFLFFMVKPVLARRRRKSVPYRLDPTKEPLLFAFVQRVAETVGAPVPRSIEVDCQVNAAAGFRHGFFSLFWPRDLVLIIGLPLAGGLTLQQFAGVLAHELGHFAQGGGMRAQYIMRRVNGWFARVVYERDDWDESLENECKNENGWVVAFAYLMRFAVWLGRRVLWLVMMIGHGLSCLLARQAEYDADRYECRLVGSDTFVETDLRIHLLSAAANVAYSDVADAWREGRLSDSLPELIVGRLATMPPAVEKDIRESAATAPTGWFSTHPGGRDRIASARREQSAGIYRLDASASLLFSDYHLVCRNASFDFYNELIGETFTDDNLVSTETMLAEQKQQEAARLSFRRFCQGVPPLHRALSLPHLSACRDTVEAAAALAAARDRVVALTPAARDAMKQYRKAEEDIFQLECADNLVASGLRFDPQEYELEEASAPAIGRRRQQLAEARLKPLQALREFDGALQERLVTALQLMLHPEVAEQSESLAAKGRGVRGVAQALDRLGGQMEAVLKVHRQVNVTGVLLSQVSRNEGNERLIHRLHSNVRQLGNQIMEVFRALDGVAYPYDKVGDAVSVATYVIPTMPSPDDPGGILRAAESMTDGALTLYWRLLGDLGARAEAMEWALDMDPLPDPPDDEEDEPAAPVAEPAVA